MHIPLLNPKITGVTENTLVFTVRQTAPRLELLVLVFCFGEGGPHASTESYETYNGRMITHFEIY